MVSSTMTILGREHMIMMVAIEDKVEDTEGTEEVETIGVAEVEEDIRTTMMIKVKTEVGTKIRITTMKKILKRDSMEVDIEDVEVEVAEGIEEIIEEEAEEVMVDIKTTKKKV
jgi:hypothetical protein